MPWSSPTPRFPAAGIATSAPSGPPCASRASTSSSGRCWPAARPFPASRDRHPGRPRRRRGRLRRRCALAGRRAGLPAPDARRRHSRAGHLLRRAAVVPGPRRHRRPGRPVRARLRDPRVGRPADPARRHVDRVPRRRLHPAPGGGAPRPQRRRPAGVHLRAAPRRAVPPGDHPGRVRVLAVGVESARRGGRRRAARPGRARRRARRPGAGVCRRVPGPRCPLLRPRRS